MMQSQSQSQSFALPLLATDDAAKVRSLALDALVAEIGPNRRVLLLGRPSDDLRRRLTSCGCTAHIRSFDDDARSEISGLIASERIEIVIIDGDLFGSTIAKNPLRQLRELVRPDIGVMTLLPNVAHASVRLAIMDGRASSDDRYYARRAIEDLFAIAGFRIDRLDDVRFDITATPGFVAALESTKIGRTYLERMLTDEEANTVEFLVIASAIAEEATNGTTLRDLTVEVAENTSATSMIASLRDRNAALERDIVALHRSTNDDDRNVEHSLNREAFDRLNEAFEETLAIAADQEREIERLAATSSDAKREAHEARVQAVEFGTEMALTREQLDLVRIELERAEASLVAEYAERKNVTAEFAATREQLDHARIELQRTAASLAAENTARAESERHLADVRAAHKLLSLEHAKEIEATAWVTADLRESLSNLELVQARALSEREEEVKAARAQLQRSEHAARERAVELEAQIALLETRLAESTTRANATIDSLRADLAALNVKYQATRNEYAMLSRGYRDLEEQLFSQSRELIKKTREELESVRHLIAGIHNSRLWRMKLAIVSARGIFRRQRSASSSA